MKRLAKFEYYRLVLTIQKELLTKRRSILKEVYVALTIVSCYLVSSRQVFKSLR